MLDKTSETIYVRFSLYWCEEFIIIANSGAVAGNVLFSWLMPINLDILLRK